MGNGALDYARFRLQYPPALIHLLAVHYCLGPGSIVADVGSGTGILTRLLLETGATVHAVEPNSPMRSTAELELSLWDKFVSVDGTAEATGLPDASVSLVCCAQAFHWFDGVKARQEFRRILMPKGECALIWNMFSDTSAFSREIEQVEAQFGSDYLEARHRRDVAISSLPAFYGNASWRRHLFPNFQRMDFGELCGRVFSGSYMPTSGDPVREEVRVVLRSAFDRYQDDGMVRLEYDCHLFLGSFD